MLSFSALFLAGCNTESTENISKENMKCVKLTQPHTLQSDSLSYTFPAGNYVALKKNNTGLFYYSTKPIQSSNPKMHTMQGIYLDNNAKKGYFFGYNPKGLPDKPVPGAALPAVIFSNLQMNAQCN